MKTPLHLTFAALAAASALLSSPVAHAVGGSCLPRALTAQETQAGERVAARLRPLLPPAPAGWKVDGEDATDIASGSCLDAATHKSIPQPVSVQVHRKFLREGPRPVAPATNVQAPRPAPAPDPRLRARVQTLEAQIKDLQRQEAAATAAYQAGRRSGDSAAQRAAIARSREIRLAMNPPRKELMDIRQAEHAKRTAENAALHEAAVAQTKASLANRRVAHVTINTNSGRALARASKVISVPGVSLAITEPGFSTSLLFGSGWTHQSHQAFRPWAPSAPTSRVQDVNVRVEGNEEAMRALIDALDLQALDALIER